MQYSRYVRSYEIINKIAALLGNTRAVLLYISTICFIILVSIISLSVKKFVNDTLSISLSVRQTVSTEQSTDEVIVKKGDTLSRILHRQDLPVMEIHSILSSIKKINNFTIRAGQKIAFDYDFIAKDTTTEDSAAQPVRRIVINPDKPSFIEILRVGSSLDFVARRVEIPLKRMLVRTSATVKTNFVDAASSLGISKSNIIDLVNIYSHQIDFQRQIHQNDKLDLVIEKFTSDNGDLSHYGKVVFASLTLSGKPYNIYRYSHDKKDHQYFSEDGKSVKRNLLRTPIAAARLSSHFGKRLHPTLGYTKMHKGVDFAAPSGTPIYAAGNGVVTHIGWRQGYGKSIQIKHSSTLSTFYAHASNFAKSLTLGSSVKQGQTIAYVGETGRTTGAHLHYEVKINGQQVNPLSIRTAAGVELSGNTLEAFKSYKKKIHKIHKELYTKREIAMVNDKEVYS